MPSCPSVFVTDVRVFRTSISRGSGDRHVEYEAAREYRGGEGNCGKVSLLHIRIHGIPAEDGKAQARANGGPSY